MNKLGHYIINDRQAKIARLIASQNGVSSGEIAPLLTKDVARSLITIKRDLAVLEKLGLIKHVGTARARKYFSTQTYTLIAPIDTDRYFSHERQIDNIYSRFDNSIFLTIKNAKIFTPEETRYLDTITGNARQRRKKLSATIRTQELERFIIEFSWKSSQIEGNTYSLLETEALIKRGQLAKNKDKKDAQMILNHKQTLSLIFNNPNKFKTLNIATIEQIHDSLVRDLSISKNIRTIAVGITGTYYRPLDNRYQIREAMEDMCLLVNKISNPFEKALVTMILLAYIQPFEDGNKRTSRVIGNAILLAYNKLPLSYQATQEEEYKKAVILFYEKHNLSYFKELFSQQYEFVAQNYFKVKNPVENQ
jgi:fido (protein-threonine AMPylation protein)